MLLLNEKCGIALHEEYEILLTVKAFCIVSHYVNLDWSSRDRKIQPFQENLTFNETFNKWLRS